MTRQLVTIGQLAETLNVSRNWLYQKVERNEIPHFRLGRAIRFDLPNIEEWLLTNCVAGPDQSGTER